MIFISSAQNEIRNLEYDRKQGGSIYCKSIELNCIEETKMKNDKCSSIIDNKNTVLFQISFEA